MMKYAKVSVMILVTFLALMSFTGCAKPPTSEMADARAEFQLATDEGAQNYAPDQYMSAEEALNQADQLMEQGKYKEAREKALQALELARQARANSRENRNSSSRSAKEMYDLALDAVNKANKAGGYTFVEDQMRDAQATLEQAKMAYDAGDYMTAKSLSEEALVKAQKVEAMANEIHEQKNAEVKQQVAMGMEGSEATPKAYPTNHVVIKGESLWWIAEYKQIYNDPFQWPLIYKANRSQIKDPDLIFPDQNFVIPRSPEVTEDMIKEAIKFAKNRGAWSLYDGK